MSLEANKALLRRVIEEIWNQRRLELFDELFAPDFINHSPAPGTATDRAGMKLSAQMLLSAFPDFYGTIEYMLAEGDAVAAYMVMHGTHHGEFMGIPPTGRSMVAATNSIVRIVDGQIVERWSVYDGLGMLAQLGAALAVPASPDSA